MDKLPKNLRNEPLIDALFEMRLNYGDASLADILSGALYNKLETKPKVSRLPTAEIPLPLRKQDPNLQFSPIVRLDFEKFVISIGDQSVVISCKLPYPKWNNFRDEIIRITTAIADIGISEPVNRFSIKYINLIKAPSITEQINKIDLNLELGGEDIVDDHISLQLHRRAQDTLHIISIITNAQARLPSGQTSGVIVDIDSIRSVANEDFQKFAGRLQNEIEDLRILNKKEFFSCLTNEALEEMGPSYE